MKFTKLFLILVLNLVTVAKASLYEAHFLDYMLEYYQKSTLSGALVQEKSENLDLKRVARKLVRDENRDIKKMKDWRSGYFEEVPNRPYWLSSTLPEELHFSESDEFDLKYIDYMISLLKTKKEVMKKALSKTSKDFLVEFIKHELTEVDRNIERLIDLRTNILF